MFASMLRPQSSPLFPYTTLFRSIGKDIARFHTIYWPAMLWSAGLEAPKKVRSEEHTAELQSRQYLVCRLLREKKNIRQRLGPAHAHHPLEVDRLVGHRHSGGAGR